MKDYERKWSIRQCIVSNVGHLVLDVEPRKWLFRVGTGLQIGRFMCIPEEKEEVQ
jgi:hypothetical protein